MKTEICIITAFNAEVKYCFHSVIGVCNNMELASSEMRAYIAKTFENSMVLNEDDNGACNGRFDDWIDKNYIFGSPDLWSYFDLSNLKSYQLKIHKAAIDANQHEAYALLRSSIVGVDTELLGVYSSQYEADGALNAIDLDDGWADEGYYDGHYTTVEKFKID